MGGKGPGVKGRDESPALILVREGPLTVFLPLLHAEGSPRGASLSLAVPDQRLGVTPRQ